MTPTATLKTGDWIATVDGEIIARGATAEEVTDRACEEGYEDFLIERVSEPATFLL